MTMVFLRLLGLLILINSNLVLNAQNGNKSFLVVLGTAQDAGYPQIGCQKDCCKKVVDSPSLKRMSASLALADPVTGKWWLFDATPDFKEQLMLFQEITKHKFSYLPSGIFITHAHMGHYLGLAQLGKEAMNAASVPVYILPRLKHFFQYNGPWSLLVDNKNISLVDLNAGEKVNLVSGISVEPFLVPHRDEFSETAGFKVVVNNYSFIYLPDIDKWETNNINPAILVKNNDLLFLDATFFKEGELGSRPMSEVPHPLVTSTVQWLQSMPLLKRNKVYFIHFNHTNPLVNNNKEALQWLHEQGFNAAQQGAVILISK